MSRAENLMGPLFAELAYAPTPKGVLSLRRRRELSRNVDVYEIKLDEEFLMSSLFTKAEEDLARLGLAAHDGKNLDVLVGGLGLGYTAREALREAKTGALLVVDALGEVIDWHRQGLLPLSEELCGDPRCRLIQGDFFTLAADPAQGFDAEKPGRRFDVILLDVDHSPRRLLHPDHGAFYERAGLKTLAQHLKPGGVFALWSDDPPDEPFMDDLKQVFATVEAQVVTFPGLHPGMEAANTVYLAGWRTP